MSGLPLSFVIPSVICIDLTGRVRRLLESKYIPCHLYATPMFGTSCFLNGKATETKHLYWQVASSAAHGQYQWADDAEPIMIGVCYESRTPFACCCLFFLRTYFNRKKCKNLDMHMNLILKRVKLQVKDH